MRLRTYEISLARNHNSYNLADGRLHHLGARHGQAGLYNRNSDYCLACFGRLGIEGAKVNAVNIVLDKRFIFDILKTRSDLLRCGSKILTYRKISRRKVANFALR